MRVALYARVSKALDQDPENQLMELRRWAEVARHDVIYVGVDEVSSKKSRPEKEKILKLLRMGTVDGVAFTMLDRWGRTMSELVLELEEFSKSGKSLISLREGIDLSTAAGRLMANVLASMANFERDMIRERTMLGLARARAQGKKIGRPSKSGKVYKKPSRANVDSLRKEGFSIRDIAKKLDTSKYWIEVVLKELKRADVSEVVM